MPFAARCFIPPTGHYASRFISVLAAPARAGGGLWGCRPLLRPLATPRNTPVELSNASSFRGLRGVCCGSFPHLLLQIRAISLRATQCHSLTIFEKGTDPIPKVIETRA